MYVISSTRYNHFNILDRCNTRQVIIRDVNPRFFQKLGPVLSKSGNRLLSDEPRHPIYGMEVPVPKLLVTLL